MFEISDATKCCFCLPLRRGLLTVGYFKLVNGIGVSLVMTFYTMLLVIYKFLEGFLLALIIFIYIILISGIIFDLLFIISAHRKSYKYLRIYYHYVIAQLLCYLVLLICVHWIAATIGPPKDEQSFELITVSVLIILIGLHIYFMYLVRSEVRKLQLNTQFIFKNYVVEPECAAHFFG